MLRIEPWSFRRTVSALKPLNQISSSLYHQSYGCLSLYYATKCARKTGKPKIKNLVAVTQWYTWCEYIWTSNCVSMINAVRFLTPHRSSLVLVLREVVSSLWTLVGLFSYFSKPQYIVRVSFVPWPDLCPLYNFQWLCPDSWCCWQVTIILYSKVCNN